jgi:hypothetical protein
MNGNLEQSMFVIGANAIKSGNKQINFLSRELHGVCGVHDANARRNRATESLNT